MITFEDLATKTTDEIVMRTLAGERGYDPWCMADCDPRLDLANALLRPGGKTMLDKFSANWVSQMIGLPIVFEADNR